MTLIWKWQIAILDIVQKIFAKIRKEIFMFSKLTLLGKSLLIITLIGYIIAFLPLGINNLTIIVLLFLNMIMFNIVVVLSIWFNKYEWESFCLKLSYLGLTTGLLIIRSFAYTWDDLCLFLFIVATYTLFSVAKTYYFNWDIRKIIHKKLVKEETE